MNSIVKCTIENFQSHENSVLDFGQGLNVIVGPSDHGKSAVIRAIKWVLYNEPRGIEFIRNGSSAARVSIEMSNGYTIVRERSKSKNKYEVIDPYNNKSVFEGFGNDIPEEVTKAHGISQIVLDEDISTSINIGDQLEGPFLLSTSGAVRAKALGRLSGVHIVDHAIRNTQVDLRRETQSASRINIDLEQLEKELEGYNELKYIEEILVKSEKALLALESKNEYILKIKALSVKFNDTIDEISRQNTLLSELKEIEKAELFFERSRLALEKMSRLKRLARSYAEVNEANNRCKKVLESTKDLKNIEPKIKVIDNNLIILFKLEKLLKQLNDLSNQENALKANNEKTKYLDKVIVNLENLKIKNGKLSKLSALETSLKDTVAKFEEGQRYIETVSNQINLNLENYTKILKEAGKCPFCKSSIDHETIDDIFREYKY